jgi:acetoin utilization deacetylase AcuC-like enzyme
MSVTTEGFRAMAAETKRLAEELCGGRVVAFQEGGYSLDHMPLCTLAIIEAFAGLEPSWSMDPLEVDVPMHVSDVGKGAVDDAATAAALA